jgi:hypothetical protein
MRAKRPKVSRKKCMYCKQYRRSTKRRNMFNDTAGTMPIRLYLCENCFKQSPEAD